MCSHPKSCRLHSPGLHRRRLFVLALLLVVTPLAAWAGNRVAPSGHTIHDDIVSGGGAATGTATHVLWGAVGQPAVGQSVAPSGLLNHGWPTLDKTRPTVTLSTTTGDYVTTETGAITVDVLLSEPVTNMGLAAISTDNASASNLTSSDALNYSFSLTPTEEGAFSCWIAEDALVDFGGNGNEASNSVSSTWDKTPPAIAIGAPAPAVTNTGPLSFVVTYSDAVSDIDEITLAVGDITLDATGDAAAGNIAVAAGATAEERTVTLSDITGNGTLAILIAAGTATDNAGNSAEAAGPSAAATVDNTSPSIAISAPSVATTDTGPVSYTVTYSDAGSGLDAITLAVGDITLDATGDAAAVTIGVSAGATAVERTVTLSDITGDGTLGISIAAGTATDNAGNSAGTAGPSDTFIVDNTPPVEGEIEGEIEGEPVEGEVEGEIEGEPVEGEVEGEIEGEPVEGEVEGEIEGEPEGLLVLAVGEPQVVAVIGAPVTFAVTVQNEIGPLSYQWYRETETKAMVSILNANDPSYTIAEATEEDAGDYQCEVYDEGADVTEWSPVFTLTLSTGIPAVGLLGLALAGALTALVGATVARKRR